MMIIDGHAHIFTARVIANVSAKPALVKQLHLDTAGARNRTGSVRLREESGSAGVKACLILPTATAEKVPKINRNFRELAKKSDFLFSAGTLHPQYRAIEAELRWMLSEGARAIKLCSFSQGFSLLAPETHNLFKLVEESNLFHKSRFFVVLDTFYLAHEYFGTSPAHTTTPALLGELVKAYPGIDFVAAHMGGLAAPPKEIFDSLSPADNLYLDTSNAAHTLAEGDFVRLLKEHGPERIIFGTDWPWFSHRAEIDLIERLLHRAGFERKQKEMVFYRNMATLLGEIPIAPAQQPSH